MSDTYLGEVRMFCGSYAPQGWAFCDGASISVANNTALYSLLGTTYGGNGQTTFQLPDLRGRLPLHHGQGPGLSGRLFGAALGAETIALTSIPAHKHLIEVGDGTASPTPANNYLHDSVNFKRYSTKTPNSCMNGAAVAMSHNGAAKPCSNMMPGLCVNFIIALEGIYPERPDLDQVALTPSSLGALRLFGFGFAPVGWANCNGPSGGSPALPDLRGRTLLHRSADYPLGSAGGGETVTLAASQVPLHSHKLRVNSAIGDSAEPVNRFLAAVDPGSTSTLAAYCQTKGTSQKTLAPSALTKAGELIRDNMQPSLALNFCIELAGGSAALDPYLGEIRAFAGGLVPPGWLPCDGQILQINQYSALYSLIGNTFGGDGKQTLGLPKLQGRAPVGAGQGPQLTFRKQGDVVGSAATPLTIENFPPHTHALQVFNGDSDLLVAAQGFLAKSGVTGGKTFAVKNSYASVPQPDTYLAADAVRATGGAAVTHDNMQPYAAVLLCIAVSGEYPPRPESGDTVSNA